MEEILEYSSKLISQVGPEGEDIFSLGSNYQRVLFFNKLRELMQQKMATNDDIAVEVLAWAWIELAL